MLNEEIKQDPPSDFNKSNSNSNSNVINDYNMSGKTLSKAKTVQGKDISNTIRILFSNIRGWKSKSISLANIANNQKLDLIVLNETHCSGVSLPKMKGYTSYGRNRDSKVKGGIAILVFDTLAKFATKLETSNDPAEFFALRLDCFTPSLVVMTTDGVIEGQYTQNELLTMQAQFFNSFESYVNEGSQVIVLGDFNNHVGNNLGLTKNNPKLSPGGRNLVRWVEDNELSLVNVKDQTHTHIDQSSKNHDTNILDLVITNDDRIIENFEVDKKVKIQFMT